MDLSPLCLCVYCAHSHDKPLHDSISARAQPRQATARPEIPTFRVAELQLLFR